MLRIIRFKIPTDKVESLRETSAFSRFRKECGDIHESRGFFYTEPMATTGDKFFMCEQYLRGAVGDPPHLVEDISDRYRLLRTRAPKSYDYDYCLDVGTMPGKYGEERLVAVPKEHEGYQSARYSSGMYTPIDCT